MGYGSVMYVGRVSAVNGPAEGAIESITYDAVLWGVDDRRNTLELQGETPYQREQMDAGTEVRAAEVGAICFAYAIDDDGVVFDLFEEPLYTDCEEGG